MKLELLEAIAQRFGQYEMIFSLRRIDDNLLRLTLDFDEFYLDMSKSKSSIFQTKERILGNPYHSPFDLALTRYCSRAKLTGCRVDGKNRILIVEFLHCAGYKQNPYALHFEFTGRHTNVILIDQNQRVLEALRHIGESKSSRVIKPNKPFSPLPQPIQDYPNHKPITNEELDLLLMEAYAERMQSRIAQKKQLLISQRKKKIDDLVLLVKQLPDPYDLQDQAQTYALWGELIFSSPLPEYFSHSFVLQDCEHREIKIELPSRIKSFAQGGNFCFAQSKKLKQKLKNLSIQKEFLDSKIAFLKREIAYIQSIEQECDLQVFLQKKHRHREKDKKDYESFFIDGIKVSIGKNAKENQKLLEDAKANDLWLHIQNIPSSHMIIHCGKAHIREEILMQSAKILLGMNGILDKNISVDYTQRRFVKIIEGANVLYSKQKTLRF